MNIRIQPHTFLRKKQLFVTWSDKYRYFNQWPHSNSK